METNSNPLPLARSLRLFSAWALSLGATTALCTSAAADYAVFYEHSNYSGYSFSLEADTGIPRLGDYQLDWFESWNDDISSVAVYGNVIVRLFEHSDYQGAYIDLDLSDPNLHWIGWGDVTSSIWVYPGGPSGWEWDYFFNSWLYWDGYWAYQPNGLGWIWMEYFDPYYSEGWIWDQSYGWLWTSAAYYPWFVRPDGSEIYYEIGSYNPRWFYVNNNWEPSY